MKRVKQRILQNKTPVILYITNGITGAGGLERVLSVKASLLAEQYGYEVHLLSLNEAGKHPFFNFSDQIIRHSVSAEGNPVQYLRQYVGGIRRKVKEIKPDVISVCDDGLKGFFIPKFAGTKIPLIYERHASVVLNDSRLQHSLMKFLALEFDKLVVLTNGNLKEWYSGNTAVIPNPVSFYPNSSAVLSSKKVIAVGSHSHNKGYDLLLQVWQNIERVFPDWTLEVYGKSVDNRYQELARSWGLQQVHFHQPYDKIEEKYLQSSVFVLPSRSEGFGMVIIEAMACGLPVVSFDCPHGPADIITDGENGFLVENGNVEKFAEKLTGLMRDKDLRKKFGAAGKETAKKYLPEIIMKQWDELFKRLLKHQP
ncbi:glycosyltransferase family 4 protein [Chryseobacterium koreense]